MLPTQPLVLRIMGGLTLPTAIDHHMTATALLKLYFAGRLVQLVEVAAGVSASNELPGQLHVHPVVYSKCQFRHSQALIETVLNEEVDERALTSRFKSRVVKASV